MADLPKVCEHINLPVQAGDDGVLERMRRPYTRDHYRELVGRIRDTIPGVSMSTDIIVGFPGETEEQFQQTMNLVSELRFDKVHCAAYSTRPGTIAHRTLDDDVPRETKDRRMKELDTLQEGILRETNSSLKGQTLEILVEGRKRGKWQGRTRTDKLVFINQPGNDDDVHEGSYVRDGSEGSGVRDGSEGSDVHDGSNGICPGQLVNVEIDHTSPWSLQGKLLPGASSGSSPDSAR